MQVARLLRTVRHLRPIQVVGQVRQRARRQWERPARLLQQPVEPWPGVRWSPTIDWLAPGPQQNDAVTIRAGELTFLNQRHAVGWPPRWRDESLPKLWQYNLHYFEYLWAFEFDAARAVVEDWIQQHPPARGHVGWEPYPISLRLMNVCALFFGRWRERTLADADFCRRMWESVHRQAQWLAVHLETHLMGNHLLENGIALAFVGACFDGRAAERWLAIGVDLLDRELPEQVLADGGHFERSPMYQARLVYALAMLINTNHPELRERVTPTLRGMSEALSRLCHPDGQIALLNDAAFEIYNPPPQLLDHVRQLVGGLTDEATGTFALHDTGYFGSRTRGGHYVVCDAGAIGPDYIPGHAHADIFSFELSLAGHRVIVDSGNFDYECSEMRAYCRSTAAHNTVAVNDADQCELWGAFRVGRRGRPRDVAWQADGRGVALEAWHDGYRWMAGQPIHRRRFRWYDEGVLLVRDQVTASTAVRAVGRIHLHPDVAVTDHGEQAVRLSTPAGPLAVVVAGADRLHVEQGWYCPEFGRRMAAPVLRYEAAGRDVLTGFCVVPGEGRATLDLEAGVVVNEQLWGW